MRTHRNRSCVVCGGRAAVLAALALVTSLSSFAESPMMSVLAANRRCSAVGKNSSNVTTHTLDALTVNNDGSSWYQVGNQTFVDVGEGWTYAASLPGYETVWMSYANAPSSHLEIGTNLATRTIATGSTVDLGAQVDNKKLIDTLLTDELDRTLLYAVFTPITYGLTYDLDDGAWPSKFTPPPTATYDRAFTLMNPSKTGCDFTGWDVGGKSHPFESGTEMTFSNLTTKAGATVSFSAQWARKQYPLVLKIVTGVARIHYRAQDADGVWSDWAETAAAETEVSVPYGRSYQCYADPAYGYVASGDTGWSEMLPYKGAMTDAGFTFIPKSSLKTYTLEVLGSAGGTARVVTGTGSYTYLTQVTIEASPNSGYTFAYWSDGNTERVRSVEVIGNRSLTAYFTEEGSSPTECHIEYHSNYPASSGLDPETVQQTIEQNVPTALKPNTWSVTGYTFTGWATASEATKAEYPDRDLQTWFSDQHLYAVWKPITYEVSFDAGEGSGTMSPQTFTYGQQHQIAFGFTKPSDMKFTGWATNATSAAIFTNGTTTVTVPDLTAIDGDHIRLYAKWELEEIKEGDLKYSRALDCMNLKWMPDNQIAWNACETELAFIKNSYDLLKAGVGSEGVYSLTYHWIPSNTTCQLRISLNNNPITNVVCEKVGTMVEGKVEISVTANSKLSFRPTNPCSLRNVTWTRKVETKPVTFDLGDGTWIGGGVVSQDVAVAQAALEPSVQPAVGWKLTGWTMKSGATTESVAVGEVDQRAISAATTFTAVYALEAYKIVYEKLRDGAVNPNPASFTKESAITFNAPTGVEDFDTWSPTGIAKGTVGDQVVTALWKGAATQNVYAVTMSVDGTVTTASVTDGNTFVFKAPKTVTVEGVTYPCTNCTGTGSVPQVIAIGDATPVDGAGNYVLEYPITAASSLSWNYATPPPPPPTYAVTFELGSNLTRTGGGTLNQTVTQGETATPPTVRAATGSAFAGWAYADASTGRIVTNDAATVARYAITADTTFSGCVTVLPQDPTYAVSVAVATGCEKMGTVSGAKKSVKPGTKVTVRATAKSGCVFAGWYPADADVSSASPVSRLASYTFAMPSEGVSLVAVFIAKADDWARVSVGEVEGEYAKGVAIAPIAVTAAGGSLPTVKVKGLPTGLKFTATLVTTKVTTGSGRSRVTTLVTNALPNTIYGTPTKSGVYAATVTATTVGKATASTNLTFVVVDRAKGERVVTTEVMLAGDALETIASAEIPGKTTGQGVYRAGKKVTLKATASKGYVFTDWWTEVENAGGGGEWMSVSRLSSLALVMPDADVAYAARFVTTARDAASISASVNGAALIIPADAASTGLTIATNVSAGVYLQWPVVADAESVVTVAVSGLPSGLKFTAKPIVTKTTTGTGRAKVTTVVTNVPAMTIYGTPTAASKKVKVKGQGEQWAVVPSQVKVTVTTAGKNRAAGVIALTVDALPSALVGTFVGGSTNEPAGSATVTLAATGKISGKWISEGKAWSLAATGLDFVDADVSSAPDAIGTIASTTYIATNVTAKSGKLVEKLTLVFSVNDCGYGEVIASALFSATYVPWKTDAALKTLAKALKGKAFTVDADVSSAFVGRISLSGKVGANGTVSVKGAFTDAIETISSTKPYTATVTATLVPLDPVDADVSSASQENPLRFELFLYYPPKANKFDGYATTLTLAWDGETFAVE